MHQDVEKALSDSRKWSVERYNAKAHAVHCKPTVVTTSQSPRHLPRLDSSCLLKVVFHSPDSDLHPGTADSAGSTLHIGTADSADSTLHLSIAHRADITLHLGIAYRVDSHDTTYCGYSHDNAYRATVSIMLKM